MDVTVTTVGFRHGEAPEAHIMLDLRQHFRDPHVSEELRYLDAEDPKVRQNVLATPGVAQAIDALIVLVDAYGRGPSDHPLRVVVGCAGGRHRAATVGMAATEILKNRGHRVELIHRDMKKAVIAR